MGFIGLRTVDEEICQTTNSCLPKTGSRFRLTVRRSPYILVGMSAARKNAKRRATKLRDPERTRDLLLQAASREIYRSGFQSASLDAILAAAGVTKGDTVLPLRR